MKLNYFWSLIYSLVSAVFFAAFVTTFNTGCSGSSSGSIGSSSEPSTDTTGKLLAISPLTKTVELGGSISLVASGGAEPYTFEIYYGNGSVTSSGSIGTYQAPQAEGTAVVRVQDGAGYAGYATIEITDALVIQPSVKALAVGNRFPFSVLSGKSPYTFSIVSGDGSINATTGEFTASLGTGAVSIRVTDTDNRTAEATVTINGSLAFASRNIYVERTASTTLSASGGVAPYTYSMASGGGSVDKTTGAFTAPDVLGTSSIFVFDSIGNVDLALVNTTMALSISPSQPLLAKNSSLFLSAMGGVPPYTYSIVSGGAGVTCIASSIVANQYTAPSVACTDRVRVTDAAGHTSDTSLTVTNSLSFSVANLILAVGNTLDISTIVSGGIAPLTYTVPAGQGAFSGTTYTAPNTPGSYTITVYDSQAPSPNSVTTTVLVNASLSLSPTSASVVGGGQKSFSASGGVPPYIYSVASGGGSFTGSLFTAPASSASPIILLVTDARGNTAYATATVQEALTLSPTTKTLNASESFSFTASGGNSPYLFSLLSGSGAINSSSGLYTAPGAPQGLPR